MGQACNFRAIPAKNSVFYLENRFLNHSGFNYKYTGAPACLSGRNFQDPWTVKWYLRFKFTHSWELRHFSCLTMCVGVVWAETGQINESNQLLAADSSVSPSQLFEVSRLWKYCLNLICPPPLGLLYSTSVMPCFTRCLPQSHTHT